MPRRGENIQKRVENRTRSDGTTYEVERWVSYVDLGSHPITGERQRKAVAADTYGEVKTLRRELLEQRDRGVKSNERQGLDCSQLVPALGRHGDQDGDERGHVPVLFRRRQEQHRGESDRAYTARQAAAAAGQRLERAWLQEERHLAPSTRRRCLTVLRKALKEAKRQRLVADNVASSEYVDGVTVH
jgi:hypothetical protein